MGASVSGAVTVDGEPLRVGMVTFHPESGPMAAAEIQSDGSYQVRTGSRTGLVPGPYVVTVVAAEGDMPPPTAQNPHPQVISFVAPRYASPVTSGLSYAIKPGKNVVNLSLTKK